MAIDNYADSDYAVMEDENIILRVRELRAYEDTDEHGLNSFINSNGIKTKTGEFDTNVVALGYVQAEDFRNSLGVSVVGVDSEVVENMIFEHAYGKSQQDTRYVRRVHYDSDRDSDKLALAAKLASKPDSDFVTNRINETAGVKMIRSTGDIPSVPYPGQEIFFLKLVDIGDSDFIDIPGLTLTAPEPGAVNYTATFGITGQALADVINDLRRVPQMAQQTGVNLFDQSPLMRFSAYPQYPFYPNYHNNNAAFLVQADSDNSTTLQFQDFIPGFDSDTAQAGTLQVEQRTIVPKNTKFAWDSFSQRWIVTGTAHPSPAAYVNGNFVDFHLGDSDTLGA